MSIKKIIRTMKSGIVFLIVFSFLVGVFSIAAWLNDQRRQIENQAQFFGTFILHNLNSIDGTMQSEILFDEMLMNFAATDSRVKELNYERELRLLLASWRENYDFDMNFMLYFSGKQDIILSEKFYGVSTAEQRRVDECRNILLFPEESGLKKGKWNLQAFHDGVYICKYYHYRNYYLGCYIHVGNLTEYYTQYDNNEFDLFFLDEEQKVYGMEASPELQTQLQSRKTEEHIFFFGNGFGTVEQLEGASFQLGLSSHNSVQSTGVLFIFCVWCLLCFLFGTAGIVLLRYMRASVVKPIYNFASDMALLKSDATHHITTENPVAELDYVGKLLEDLSRNLKKLRIDAYEKELGWQKTQLDYQTLLSKPHFYINCLNTIYAMADMRQYESIQQLCKHVSDYIRYLFYSCDSLVLLSEELKCLKSYLSIQKKRYEESVQFFMDIADGVGQTLIPPFIILTFVENSIHHAIDVEGVLTINLRVLRGDRRIFLQIEDNGAGFDSEVLEKLNNGQSLADGNRHIGISNIIQRLSILYGGAEKIHFTNGQLGGACIDISIPLDKSGTVEGEKDEPAFGR